MPLTTNGAPYPPGTGVLPDVPYWMQLLAEWADGAVYGGDTDGWQDLTLVNDWTVASGLTPQYRIYKGLVFLRGRVSGGTDSKIAALPVGARPVASTVVPVVSGGFTSGTPALCLLNVSFNGDISANTGTTPNLTPPAFVPVPAP